MQHAAPEITQTKANDARGGGGVGGGVGVAGPSMSRGMNSSGGLTVSGGLGRPPPAINQTNSLQVINTHHTGHNLGWL